MATRAIHIEPDARIADLIGRLTDDSKRLVRDEVRLAKLEIGESVHSGTRGGIWLGIAFGAGILALVALTILLTVVLGTVILGDAWAGALITGVLEIAVGGWLVLRGVHRLKHTRYTLGESREELQQTAAWIARETAS